MSALQDKVAIVTGGSKGIGKAIAEAIGMQGATVVIAARNSGEVSSTADELRANGMNTLAVPTDVADDSQVQNLIDTAFRKFGRIDIVVNNAGFGIFKKFAELSVEEFDAMWGTNMRGVFLVTKRALPHLMRHGGDIVNIASLAGKNSFAGGTGYAATKWALRGFAGSLMLEVRDANVRVITICPGSVDTGFSTMNKRGDTITQPRDVADAVVFALTAPGRTMISEIDIRPTNPQ